MTRLVEMSLNFIKYASLLMCAWGVASCTSTQKTQPELDDLEYVFKNDVHFYEERDGLPVNPDPINHQKRLDIFKKLIKNGLDVNATDNEGVPALGHAAAVGDVAYMKALLGRGARVTFRNLEENLLNDMYWSPNSPMDLAVEFRQKEAALLLLQHGANPRGIRNAIAADDREMIDLLLAHGADIHQDENIYDEVVPNLYFAKSASMVRYLVDKGCSVDQAIRYFSDGYSGRNIREKYRLFEDAGVLTDKQRQAFKSLF